MEAATITHLHPAHLLEPSRRQELALKVIKNEIPVSDIARANNVSRKFLYQQKDKALTAVNSEFTNSDDSDVIFYLPITKAWIISFIMCLLLHCRSSFRGVQKILMDAIDYKVSIGTISNYANDAAIKAKTINLAQDLSNIKTAAPDELFHQNNPVLAGVDTRSLYCYLLAHEQHRDSDTWAIHLWDLERQGFNPERFIADNAKGLRLGHEIAFPYTRCDGDTFHITKDMMDVRRFIRNEHKSAVSHWLEMDDKMNKAKLKGLGHKLSRKLQVAEKNEIALWHLTKTFDTLVSWMQHDVLQLPGLDYDSRSELYDFIVAELKVLEKPHPHRIKELRISLENQKTSLLSFVEVLNEKFKIIAQQLKISSETVWSMCTLLRCNLGSDKHSIRSVPLQLELGDELFEKLENAVIDALNTTDKTSCMIENFNSRLAPYFDLRKGIGNDYLQLLQFYLNHTPFLRSKHDYRKGKTPAQIMTGKSHNHWLEMLGLARFTRAAA